ncbi:helix-turn-helix transcriptional regulator [Methylobacterium planeticum]|uniref:Helix-turn-helix transcriptional regulator n=2 Tax=Methylobacterium planeticum TaxID=2615211 RepID=A0A6N6MM53_9HYPH|nr:helix-turn-helix transcriptional regulator [Methylobacterium planeticum]
MGNQRRSTCQVLGRLDHRSQVVIERRINGAGSHPRQAYPCNELIVMLGGRSVVRRSGDGQNERCLARAGTAWTGPVGFMEKAELSDAIACLHVCLPPALIEHSALADYGIDASLIELAFVGGLADPLLLSFAQAFDGVLARPPQPTDQLFIDGLTTALAAHLIANYTIDRWKPPTATQKLDRRRLKRVLDYIDAHFAELIRLDHLADEACLSPFHFARLFREATGVTPHRYVTNRRVHAAREALALDQASLLEIALAYGFGTQDNFIRVFRKSTGLTPGQYRNMFRP